MANFFNRLKSSLQKTRQQFSEGLANLFLGKKVIDADLLTALETHLLTADVGVHTTQSIMQNLTASVARKELNDAQTLLQHLQTLLYNYLKPCEQPLEIPNDTKPFVILVVGVNGAGKTTTIGKLAKNFQSRGNRVLLAAGDTFRAAAIDQLKIWAERHNTPIIAQQPGADSASVIYDAVQSGITRQMDIVLADTAGRLHTQSHLMEELKKIKRVLNKLDPKMPHETLLVLDAGIGQNALQQAKQFHEAIPLTGLVLTKLDGTAKGGIIFALAEQLRLPIRFIGVGEKADDLKPFVAQEFIDALFEDISLE